MAWIGSATLSATTSMPPNAAGAVGAAAGTVAAGEPSAEDWASDLDRLLREIRYRHPNPEHFGPAWEDFADDAARLRAALPGMPDWRIPWEFSRLVATLADGHTWVDPWSLDTMGAMTPLRYGFYEDGLFVIGARASHEDAQGSRVVRIAGVTPSELLDRARDLRLTSADNDMSLRWWTAHHLSMPTALAALGAIDEPGPVTVELESPEGARRELVLHAPASGRLHQYPRVDGSRPPERSPVVYYVEARPEEGVLYWRWDGFREDAGSPWEPFCARAFATFEDEGLERLVLDLRGNGGGDNAFGRAVLRGILRQPALDEPNALIVLIGPATDSAAVSFCVELEELTNPVFVGMPTFLRPNGHSNAFSVALPRTGLSLHLSTMYWRAGHPTDRRPWVVPHVPVPVHFADVRTGRDRALEIALAGVEPPRRPSFKPRVRRGHAGHDLERALEEWRAETPLQRWVDVELDINALGYELLNAGRTDDAIEVFELNSRLHPYASNVYDSWGEALLKAGDEAGALAAYREAVRRDHGNVAGIEIVLELEDRLER